MKDFIKKADIILAIVLLVAGFGSLALLRTDKAEKLKAVVYCEGKAIDEIDLSQKGEFSMIYEVGNHPQGENYNTVKYLDGSIWIEDTDCPGKDCMQFGKISKSGQVIVCAPHKILIQITGGDGVDSTAY